MDLDKGEVKMVVGTWNTTRTRENAPTDNSDEKFGCPCGRSPTGKCIGWHRLSEEGYVDMYAKYQKVPVSEQDEFFKNNKVPKKKTEASLEEAYDAIVMGLGIMAEGLGGDIDPDIIKANPLLEGEIVMGNRDKQKKEKKKPKKKKL